MRDGARGADLALAAHVHTTGVLIVALGYASGAYLAYRAVLAWLRRRWARHAYPRVSPGPAPDDWHQRCRGALLGLAVGDAVNLPAESLPRWLARLRYPGGPRMRRGILRARRAGDVSDDTQLTIAVARSIFPDGTYSHDRFVDELARWSYFRVAAGRACSTAAIHARSGTPRGVASEGNGAAIRVAPLAIALVAEPDDTLVAAVDANARATHTTDAAIRGAAFVAYLVREALRRPPNALGTAEAMAAAIEHARLISGFDVDVPATQPRAASGHVRASIGAACWILQEHCLDYQAAMDAIFRGGGDTDSIGAIVGAVIGAQLGAAALPATWVQSVQHRDYLCWLADRLAEPAQTHHLDAGAALEEPPATA